MARSNIDLGYGEIHGQRSGSNVLGESESKLVSGTYSSVKSAFQAQGAASTLPSNSSLSGSLRGTIAKAQALGLYPSNRSLDGYVGFSGTLLSSCSTTATRASDRYYFSDVTEHEISVVMGMISLLNYASNAYALMDLSLDSSSDVRDLPIGGTCSVAVFPIDNPNLGTWDHQTSNRDPGDSYTQGAPPEVDGPGSDVLTFSCTVVATDSDVSSVAVQSVNLNEETIGNNFNSGAAADEANGALPLASDVQALKDLSSSGSDEVYAITQIVHDFAPGASLAFYSEQVFANGTLATNVMNAQDIASGVLGTPQGSAWQSSVTTVGSPGGAAIANWIGGEGIFGNQPNDAGLHAAAADGGLAAVTTSSALATFAPADLASLANPVAGSFGAPITDASIGSNGATAAQVQQALDESGLSVNGSGIRVGVLSDSFNDLGGAAADEADGALPPAADIDVIKDLASGGTDEGRAMMQIIHDIAPGASLAFYTAFDSEQDFANGILALAAAGCKVIVDDVSYFDEPFFQNGVVAQAIQTVEAEGVTYVTAAGNDASNGYQAVWTPISGTYDGRNLTDAQSFGGSLVQTITLNTEGYDVPLLLEWNQAYGDATSDLEILVFHNGTLYGTATNRTSGEPTNPWVDFTFTASGTYQIAIVNLSGPNPGLIKEITEGDGVPVTISGANAGTVYGHAMTPGAITAGAVSTADTPAFGVNPPVSESYSSSGAGTELLFANNGTLLSSPDMLSPVAVSGVDNINTTLSLSSGLGDFYGTSAASASLAGVVALMLQANPNLTPAQVEQILEATALQMANSVVSGAGLVQADLAIADALALGTITVAEFLSNETELNQIVGGFAISDTAANVYSHLAALAADASHITSITATGGQVTVGNGLFVADEAALNEIVGGFAISGQASVLSGNLNGLEADISRINSITGLNGTITAPSIARFLSDETALNEVVGGFAISDTSANVYSHLAALAADASHIVSITATGGQVTVGNGLFVADQAALNEIVGGFAISGQASVLSGNLNGLEADISHINSITGLNGTITATAAQFFTDLTALNRVVGGYDVDVPNGYELDVTINGATSISNAVLILSGPVGLIFDGTAAQNITMTTQEYNDFSNTTDGANTTAANSTVTFTNGGTVTTNSAVGNYDLAATGGDTITIGTAGTVALGSHSSADTIIFGTATSTASVTGWNYTVDILKVSAIGIGVSAASPVDLTFNAAGTDVLSMGQVNFVTDHFNAGSEVTFYTNVGNYATGPGNLDTGTTAANAILIVNDGTDPVDDVFYVVGNGTHGVTSAALVGTYDVATAHFAATLLA